MNSQALQQPAAPGLSRLPRCDDTALAWALSGSESSFKDFSKCPGPPSQSPPLNSHSLPHLGSFYALLQFSSCSPYDGLSYFPSICRGLLRDSNKCIPGVRHHARCFRYITYVSTLPITPVRDLLSSPVDK